MDSFALHCVSMKEQLQGHYYSRINHFFDNTLYGSSDDAKLRGQLIEESMTINHSKRDKGGFYIIHHLI